MHFQNQIEHLSCFPFCHRCGILNNYYSIYKVLKALDGVGFYKEVATFNVYSNNGINMNCNCLIFFFLHCALCKVLTVFYWFLFQMCLADANLSFPVHSLTIKRSGQDSPKECKEVNLFDCN